MKYLITDQKGNKDASKTLFVLAGLISVLRVLFGGVAFGDFTVPEADYTGLAAFVGAFGAIHFGRSHTKSQEQKNVL